MPEPGRSPHPGPSAAPAPVRPARGRLRRALAAAAACALAAGAAGACDDANEIFTGVWASETAHSGLFLGAPRLALGHFGREVAGVAYFPIVPGGSLLEPSCPCAFVEHRAIDFSDRQVEFSTSCPGLALEWRLALAPGRSDVLEGTVRRADGAPGEESVRLVLEEDFVREELKVCDEGTP